MKRVTLAIAFAFFIPNLAIASFDPKVLFRTFFEELAKSGIPDAVAIVLDILKEGDETTLRVLRGLLEVEEQELIQAVNIVGGANHPDAQVFQNELKGVAAFVQQVDTAKKNIAPSHPEQGSDPFFSRMQTTAPIIKPAVGESVQAIFRLELSSPTTPDLQPAAYVVLPPMAGNVAVTVHPSAALIAVSMHNDDGSGTNRLELNSFSYTMESFSIQGVPTGVNRTELATDIGAPLGNVRLEPGSDLGTFTLRFAATMSNDLYGPARPFGPAIPLFVQATGAIDLQSGLAVVTAQDPMLLPGVPGTKIESPMFVAPTMARFDANRGTITFHDMFFDAEAGLNSGIPPKIAFLRFVDGTYGTFDNSLDRMLGAELLLGDLHIRSILGSLVRFDPSSLLISDDAGTMLRAGLTNIFFDLQTDAFFGDFDFTTADFVRDLSGSPFLAQYLATPGLRLQLLGPGAAGALSDVTQQFTQSGQTVEPDFVNGVSEVPEPSTWLLLGSGFVALAIARRKLVA